MTKGRRPNYARRILLSVAVALWAANMVWLSTRLIAVNTYSSPQPHGGVNHGVVIGWQGHGPGPVQCAGFEYGSRPGVFVNVDC